MISESDIETYARDGVICLRRVFSEVWLDVVGTGVQAVVSSPGPMSFVERDDAGRTTYVSDMFSWVTNTSLRSFIFESPAAEIATSLMRAQSVNLLSDQAFLRLPGSRRRTDWHNDKGYWPVRGELLCSIWLPLQATAIRDGGIEYIIGSHRWATMYKNHFFHLHREFNLAPADREGGFLKPAPPVEQRRDEYPIKGFDLEPGDCLVHHPLVLHAAATSATGRRRFAYSVSFAGEDVRFAPRVDTHRIPFDSGLSPGDVLDSELFPRLRG